MDFSTVDPIYPSKSGLYAFTRTATLARGQFVLKSLSDRPESVIAVVSHSGFLRTAVSQRHFANADYRIFEFEVTEGGDSGLNRLREIERTEENGGGMGWSYKGRAKIEEGDFPPQEAEQVGSEVVGEVPR